jgi:hypothetical protein
MPLPQEKFQLHRKGESIPERSPFYMWERLSSRDHRAPIFLGWKAAPTRDKKA